MDAPTTYFVSGMDGKSVVESPSGRIVCVATTPGEARKIAAALIREAVS